MPDPEEDRQAEKREVVADQRCPVFMSEGQCCGRPVHAAPSGVDLRSVCLMHSEDPNKSDAAFQEEFERILRDADDQGADFTRFVFPSSNYARRVFRAKCIFLGATFTQKAIFMGATFTHHTDFGGAAFTRYADFSRAKFTQDAHFYSAKFAQGAHFYSAKFAQGANFYRATFTENADFSWATFTQGASFGSATFACGADFAQVTFGSKADFGAASFSGTADFHNSTFAGLANFSTTRFLGDAKFVEVHFEAECSFWLSEFKGIADFHHAAFGDAVEFRETTISNFENYLPAPIFVLAKFAKPESVVFYKTYLGRALFHNCDVSRFYFSSVRWRGRSGNGKRMVFDEVVDTQDHAAGALRTEDDNPNDRNYDLIAELYQQLKKNYDDRRDYWTAGDFHYGEMEMKRLATPKPNRLSRWLKEMGLAGPRFDVFRRRWHQQVGLAALYKGASEYGESYERPLLWLLVVLLFSTVLYPGWGLRPTLKAGTAQAAAHESLSREACVPELSYRNFIRYGSLQPGGEELSPFAPVGHSLMTSLGVAALQRDLAYEPSYPWARVLSWLELALTSTFIALFLLAVRRQFRR
ncbi:MAG: pentapeptide repeat-containing protein [Acidobacteriia bacterium]|nr:pentapeptide repeat-containing protein [Terriglobia bacterium]